MSWEGHGVWLGGSAPRPPGYDRDRTASPSDFPKRILARKIRLHVEVEPKIAKDPATRCPLGRWTRYLLGFETIYAVDYYEELLVEFRKTFARYQRVKPIKNSRSDFPGIALQSVNYVLSFGCFGHINQTLIDGYLRHIKTILKPGGNVAIHYSDKNKFMARHPGFTDNTPEQMRALVLGHGYTIIQEDTTTMWNGSIIHFTS